MAKRRFKYWIYRDVLGDLGIDSGLPKDNMLSWAKDNNVSLYAGPFSSRKAAEDSVALITDYYKLGFKFRNA